VSKERKDFSPDVVVIGVGFVGLTLAMSLCSKGFKVLGVEKRKEIRVSLSNGITDVQEPSLGRILERSLGEGIFRISDRVHKGARAANEMVFIVTVGTPIINKKVENDAIINAVNEVRDFLRDGDLLIIRSTVAIGTCRNLILPILSQTGLKIRLAMCPERTIEGNALEEIQELPQIVGGIDKGSSRKAIQFFKKFCKEVIEVSSIESAEFLKLANNTYRDLNFAFANELTLLATKIGISSREIINAANYNYPRSRISSPGPSGGPCLEKDPWILYESGNRFGLEMEISKASRLVNESSTMGFISEFINSIDESLTFRTVGLLGLSFKGEPKVQDTRGAFSLQIVRELSTKDFRFYGFEPAGPVQIQNVHTLSSMEEVLQLCEIIVIVNNSQEFKEIPDLLRAMRKSRIRAIVDMWGILVNLELPKGIQYISWG